ncbi:dpcd family protein [Cystoisospora suis]|uniref:Protein DPCD n=1 Tax=Cystoisospora suis TaxID=483139 RepID=A0A2C6KKV9_9APIC|nr:dpcd family protein [Cystoisospora suis]
MLVTLPLHVSGAKTDKRSGAAEEPRSFCITADGRRKVHTTYPDQSEMIEEYNAHDDTIVMRKFRRPTPLGGEGSWEYLIGAPPSCQATVTDSGGNVLLTPSATSPICVMLDTKTAFEWRIRNLPYPKSTYQVSVDVQTSEIIVRTTNKKYFKKLCIPEMSKLRIPMNPESLSWTHQHSTLVVVYLKPKAVCHFGVTRTVLDYQKKAAEASRKGAVRLT